MCLKCPALWTFHRYPELPVVSVFNSWLSDWLCTSDACVFRMDLRDSFQNAQDICTLLHVAVY
jgi:hypothetical protein